MDDKKTENAGKRAPAEPEKRGLFRKVSDSGANGKTTSPNLYPVRSAARDQPLNLAVEMPIRELQKGINF